jgi:branched-chain amino acid transport system ATP-binding protein
MGKSTLIRTLLGHVKQREGHISLRGTDVSRASPHEVARLGVAYVPEGRGVFPNLSVLENVRLAVQATKEGAHRRGLNLWSIWSDHAQLTNRALEILQSVSMSAQQDAPVASLPHGDQRKLEVALLMALEPAVYMFDEPTAGMSQDEAPVILNLIRQLKSDKTKTILLVEHKMDVVRELADRIIVLHNGQLVADGEPAEVMASAVVQEAYLGAKPSNLSYVGEQKKKNKEEGF